jgi:hypothetical protein
VLLVDTLLETIARVEYLFDERRRGTLSLLPEGAFDLGRHTAAADPLLAASSFNDSVDSCFFICKGLGVSNTEGSPSEFSEPRYVMTEPVVEAGLGGLTASDCSRTCKRLH